MLKTSRILALLLITLILVIVFNYNKIQRLLAVNSFFEPENIVSNFQDADGIFPVTDIPPSSRPLILPQRLDYNFPATFTHGGVTFDVSQFIDDTSTEGLLVIHNDTIVYEDYRLGLEVDERHISWSLSKSFIATLVGVMIDNGKVNLADQVSDYLPDFEGTAYENVSIKNLLQMSSGVGFNEDYGDFNSDINRFGRAFALGTSYLEFAKSLKNEVPPGSRNHYVSIDTQVLGFILSKVSGKSLTALLQEYIWEPAGMEHAGGWVVDNSGFEMALGGLMASLRDYAKLGLMHLHKGKLNGRQIVSPEWASSATTPLDSHVKPGRRVGERLSYGYGYQWWIPKQPMGDFYAAGIYCQYVYIYPEKNLVIAKLSADHRFKTGRHDLKAKHISFFQEVARQFISS